MEIKKLVKIVWPFVLLLCIYLIGTHEFITSKFDPAVLPIYKLCLAVYAILVVSVKDIVRKLQ